MFGISQDPITKNYIVVFNCDYFESIFCKKCFKIYTDKSYKWCKPCEINNLKKNFTKWTSGNKQIDSFIQGRQLKIYYCNKLFEWIPYDKFNYLKELGKSDLFMVYSALWKNGPLYYDYHNKKEWMRESDKMVVLKYFLQNSINELLYEV